MSPETRSFGDRGERHVAAVVGDVDVEGEVVALGRRSLLVRDDGEGPAVRGPARRPAAGWSEPDSPGEDDEAAVAGDVRVPGEGANSGQGLEGRGVLERVADVDVLVVVRVLADQVLRRAEQHEAPVGGEPRQIPAVGDLGASDGERHPPDRGGRPGEIPDEHVSVTVRVTGDEARRARAERHEPAVGRRIRIPGVRHLTGERRPPPGWWCSALRSRTKAVSKKLRPMSSRTMFVNATFVPSPEMSKATFRPAERLARPR